MHIVAISMDITKDQIEVFLQPKVNARTKEISGVEALVRWRFESSYQSICKTIPRFKFSTIYTKYVRKIRYIYCC